MMERKKEELVDLWMNEKRIIDEGWMRMEEKKDR